MKPKLSDKKNGKLVILFIIIFPFIGDSQLPANQFLEVDSFASTIKYRTDLTRLTQELTKSYQEELLKARAIFRWITENIRYDYKYYNRYYYKNKEPKKFKCKNDNDCEAKEIAWEIKYIDKVLRKKKAICLGYSLLFKKMCDIAGLKSELIPGYVRTRPTQVGTAGTLDHAWNALWIDSTYHLIDATWAAGFTGKNEDGELLFFKKKFNEYYWLTPPAKFALDHYPQASKWTLLTNYTKENFSANPYYASDFKPLVKLLSPTTGLITVKKGDTIFFKMEYSGYLKYLQINSNLFRNPEIWIKNKKSKGKQNIILDSVAVKKQQYIPYSLNNGILEFQYIATNNSLTYLDILFDKDHVMRFRVHIDRTEQ